MATLVIFHLIFQTKPQSKSQSPARSRRRSIPVLLTGASVLSEAARAETIDTWQWIDVAPCFFLNGKCWSQLQWSDYPKDLYSLVLRKKKKLLSCSSCSQHLQWGSTRGRHLRFEEFQWRFQMFPNMLQGRKHHLLCRGSEMIPWCQCGADLRCLPTIVDGYKTLKKAGQSCTESFAVPLWTKCRLNMATCYFGEHYWHTLSVLGKRDGTWWNTFVQALSVWSLTSACLVQVRLQMILSRQNWPRWWNTCVNLEPWMNVSGTCEVVCGLHTICSVIDSRFHPWKET